MSEVIHKCGHCHFDFPDGASVCQACCARQLYCATPAEIEEAAKNGLYGGSTAMMALLYGVPFIANNEFGLAIEYGFGMELNDAVFVALIAGACAAFHAIKSCKERLEDQIRSIR